MKRISVAEIRRLDQAASQDYGIPTLLLMENAGRSVADVILRDYKPSKTLIFAGKGNNGGDGFVVARHLANCGYSVKVVLLGDPARLKSDPLLNFTIIRRMNIPVVLSSESTSEEELFGHCLSAELIVDAILGIGVDGPVHGVFETAIHAINQSQKPVISIDVPSGLNADTGQVPGLAVKATTTVTLALPKAGLFEGEGPKYAGTIEVADIGIPRELLLPFCG